VVSEIINNDKIIVRGYNGVVFYIKLNNDQLGKIKVGDRLALAQNNLAILDIMPEDKDYRATALELIDRPKITFNQIGGLESVIQEIDETVTLPLTKPEKFKEFGIESPKGVLLYGPPGTGKTLLGKAVANKANATFINVSGSELIHKFIGEGAKIVKDVFSLAREKAPAIIFIDEIDAVAAYRLDATSGADREVHRTLMQLLVEMDGFRGNDNVKIIAATNRIDIIDEAILRPGRFDRIIEVPLPNKDARKEIFKIHAKNMPLSKDVTIDKLAEISDNCSGAEIEAICKEAGIFAIRNNDKDVKLKYFEEAKEKVQKKPTEDEVHGRIYS
jgi:proteasome regulatory subunit